ncbi:surface lipoprotein assembly modifier [Dinoroseobacter shibae]|uniref:surface lipoprotein assembly modifier n=1 Tax=Dinoroseobacter shibae TaxID=215813 RepID=UPI000300F182|nr:surface lipoprotein assembly modifier [Dinoroseobacter shibae]URF47743.1 surface lipoprotein assembly modifier [Dinoroseobacter shibae]URF52053.1 surface lipoprotein assembly modifier [Dinoroseobacter shibae]
MAAQPALPGAARSTLPVDGAAIEARFLRGLALLNGGQAAAAIPLFLDILAGDPTLVRVRLELARAYFAAEQWSRAREEFFAVLSTDLPEPARLRVLGFIRAIDARRGFDWDLSIGLVTLGERRRYDSDTVDLEIAGTVLPFTLERDTDTEPGLRVTGAARWRQGLTRVGATELVGFAGVDLDALEGPGARYDDITIGARTGVRFLGARSSVVAAAFGRSRHVAGDGFEDRFGLDLSFERRSAGGVSVFGAASWAVLDSAISDDRDGHAVAAQLGLRRSVGGRATLGAALRVEENRVAFDLEDYRDTELRVFGSYDAVRGITLRPELSLRYRDFRDPSPLFTASPNERAVQVALTVQKSDLFLGDGFSPFARVSHTRSRSDIDAYSYTESEVQIGLERRF